MDNFYKCILYDPVPSIFFFGLSRTRQKWGRRFAIDAAESSNYVRKDPAFRLYSSNLLPNKCKASKCIYIYEYTIEETQFGAMSSQVAICSRRIPLDGCTLLRCSFRNFEYTIHSDSSSLLCSTSQLVSLSFDFSSPFTSLRIFTRRIVKFESSPFPSFLYSFRRLTKD